MDDKIKLFFVANSKYKNLEDLSGVENSAKNIYQFFAENICKKNNIVFIENKDSNYVKEQFNYFIDNVDKDDLCIFYFCGHGFLIEPNYNDLLMATSDTDKSTVKLQIGFPYSLLHTNIQQSSIKKSIIIIDSCYSGKAIQNMGDGNIFKLGNKNCPDGSVVISSTSSNKLSFVTEIKGKKYAGFSYYLWKTLCEKSNTVESFRSIKDVFNKTKDYIKNDKVLSKLMEPQIYSLNSLIDYKFIPYSQNRAKFSRLEVIDWRITSNCNNSCGFCYATKGCNDLSKNDIDKVLTKINQLDCSTICITGGEPSLNKNFCYIIEQLYNSQHSIYLSTNGTCYFDNKDKIEKYLDKLSLPLDGYCNENNTINGRNGNSFNEVLKILDYYKKTPHKFSIKISSLLSKKNNNPEHFRKMYNLLKEYPIDIWKIYEFIPESEGIKNKKEFELKRNISRIELEIKELRGKSKFKIELVKRKERDAAYFIIQPDASVMIPTENTNSGTVEEANIGNMLEDDINDILDNWYKKVKYDNYFKNLRVRDFKRPIILDKLHKDVLYQIISANGLPSLELIASNMNTDIKEIGMAFDNLYNYRIVKNTIPIIKLEYFNLKKYLVTLKMKNTTRLSKKHIAEILCFNDHIGWISEFENGNFRISIFAKELHDVDNMVNEIGEKYLSEDLDDFTSQEITNAYAFGEERLLNPESSNVKNEYIKENIIPKNKIFLNQKQYNVLVNFKLINKATIENINGSVYFDEEIDIVNVINELKDIGVIEKLFPIIDTKLIGYSWYLIFVKLKSYQKKLDKIAFSNYLVSKFNSVTHINCFANEVNTEKYIMDFEVHVKSYAELEYIIDEISKDYDNIYLYEPIKIIQEHKFDFTTKTVLETIYDNYLEK